MKIEYSISSEIAFQKAKEQKLKVVLPKDNELLIDIDSGKDYEAFLVRLSFIKRFFKIKEIEHTVSQSGLSHKRHIRVVLVDSVTPLERIFLQLALSSDYKREVFSFLRVLTNDPHPTIFLEKETKEVIEHYVSPEFRVR
jgi:hypothetical protein